MELHLGQTRCRQRWFTLGRCGVLPARFIASTVGSGLGKTVQSASPDGCLVARRLKGSAVGHVGVLTGARVEGIAAGGTVCPPVPLDAPHTPGRERRCPDWRITSG